MKHKREFIVFLTFAILLTMTYLPGSPAELGSVETNPATSFGIQQLYPIEITSNSDFSKYATPGGAGTAGNPWVIENKIISNATAMRGIYIVNTTDYFVIEDCTIELAIGSEEKTRAIHMENVTHVNITNNRIIACEGVFLNNSEFVRLSGNRVNYSACWVQGFGVQLDYCNHCDLSNNTLITIWGLYGLTMEHTDNFEIYNNSITAVGSGTANTGLKFVHCNHGEVRNNTLTGGSSISSLGNEMAYCSYVDLINNTITHFLYLLVGTCYHGTIWGNHLEFQWMGISMMQSDNTTIAYNTILGCTKYYGIELSYSHMNNVTQNTINNGKDQGILLTNANNNDILNNTINGNGGWGIEGISSSGNTIRWNTILNNGAGCIDIDRGANTVSDNDCGGGVPSFPYSLVICSLFAVAGLIMLRTRRPQV